MSNKKCKQWYFDAPWGKIAVVSWGHPANQPVLLLHGYMDTAATFIPILEKLPETYYYVGFDLPGHGLSDPLPSGVLPLKINFVEAVRIVVDKMNWTKFILLTHSMGSFIGWYYNGVFSNQITKMINIDPFVPLSGHFISMEFNIWYKFNYDDLYYSDYARFNAIRSPKEYTHEEAVKTLARNRELSEEDADVILSRSLIPVGNGKYRLSWDQKMKTLRAYPLPEETLFYLLTKRTPPTLNILVTVDKSLQIAKQWTEKFLLDVVNTAPNTLMTTVNGPHDAHITNVEEVSKVVIEFLNRDFNFYKSKI